MKDIQLSQVELKIIVNILQQVQLVYKDSKVVNLVIDKLTPFIEVEKPQEVSAVPVEPVTEATDTSNVVSEKAIDAEVIEAVTK